MQPTLTTTPRRIATGQTPSTQLTLATTRPEHSPKKDLFFGSGKDQQDTTEKSFTQQVKDFFSWLFTHVKDFYSWVQSWFVQKHKSPNEDLKTIDPEKTKRFVELLSQDKELTVQEKKEALELLESGKINPNGTFTVADKNSNNSITFSFLHAAILGGYDDIVDKLLSKCNSTTVNTRITSAEQDDNSYNQTPLASLMLKSLRPTKDATRAETLMNQMVKLVEAGADLNLTYKLKDTDLDKTLLQIAQEQDLIRRFQRLETILTPKAK